MMKYRVVCQSRWMMLLLLCFATSPVSSQQTGAAFLTFWFGKKRGVQMFTLFNVSGQKKEQFFCTWFGHYAEMGHVAQPGRVFVHLALLFVTLSFDLQIIQKYWFPNLEELDSMIQQLFLIWILIKTYFPHLSWWGLTHIDKHADIWVSLDVMSTKGEPTYLHDLACMSIFLSSVHMVYRLTHTDTLADPYACIGWPTQIYSYTGNGKYTDQGLTQIRPDLPLLATAFVWSTTRNTWA